jgi:hypothetical protein
MGKAVYKSVAGIKVRFPGLSGLNNILSQTKWALESSKEIDGIFVVFTPGKSVDKE